MAAGRLRLDLAVGIVSHRLHALLGVAVEVLGFLAGLFLALRLLGNPVGLVSWIPWLVVLALAALVPRALYRHLVPARCPRCRAVAAYLRGTHPWRYECRDCGHVHATSMSDGGGPRFPGEPEEDDGRPAERS